MKFPEEHGKRGKQEMGAGSTVYYYVDSIENVRLS